MLQARKISFTIEALRSEETTYSVVFNFDEGNAHCWHDSWDEDLSYPSIEIVDVFEIVPDGVGQSVYNLLSDEEEDYIIDFLFALREDGEC